jgi:tRNA pseudouridine13 synthase
MYPGVIKQQYEDWKVCEISAEPLTGEGEHAYFFVEKVGLNTEDIVRSLCDAWNVSRVDVGYAGRKDRHVRKLRIGNLLGNHFDILLRDAEIPAEQLDHLTQGFPNLFGIQRVSASNVAQAQTWLQSRPRRVDRKAKAKRTKNKVPSRSLEGWHMSVLRSHLFNEVVKLRLLPDSSLRVHPGDVLEAGFPSAPLWGRGRSRTKGEALSIEEQALAPFKEVCDGLEFAGVQQARRAMWVKPSNWQIEGLANSQIRFSFTLPKGVYATSLLAAAHKE